MTGLKKIAVVVSIIIVCLGIALVGIYEISDGIRYEKNKRLYESESMPLNLLKSEKLAEYARVEEQMLADAGCKSELVFVSKGADAQLYDGVFKLMNETGASINGVVCFSGDDLVGMPGNITKQQLDLMTAAGWTTGVYWDGEGSLDDYLNVMQAHFKGLGIPMFDTVMFVGGCYNESYDELLGEYDVGYAIHSGEGYLPLLESSVSGILRIGYVPWGDKVSLDLMDSLITWGGITSFMIDYLEYPDVPGAAAPIYSTSSFDSNNDDCVASFGRLLAYVKERTTALQLCADTPSGARLDRAAYLDEYEALLPAVEERKAQLLDEIAAIDADISEIYRKYFPED